MPVTAVVPKVQGGSLTISESQVRTLDKAGSSSFRATLRLSEIIGPGVTSQGVLPPDPRIGTPTYAGSHMQQSRHTLSHMVHIGLKCVTWSHVVAHTQAHTQGHTQAHKVTWPHAVTWAHTGLCSRRSHLLCHPTLLALLSPSPAC